jgi:hypothetical protein
VGAKPKLWGSCFDRPLYRYLRSACQKTLLCAPEFSGDGGRPKRATNCGQGLFEGRGQQAVQEPGAGRPGRAWPDRELGKGRRARMRAKTMGDWHRRGSGKSAGSRVGATTSPFGTFKGLEDDRWHNKQFVFWHSAPLQLLCLLLPIAKHTWLKNDRRRRGWMAHKTRCQRKYSGPRFASICSFHALF